MQLVVRPCGGKGGGYEAVHGGSGGKHNSWLSCSNPLCQMYAGYHKHIMMTGTTSIFGVKSHCIGQGPDEDRGNYA